MKALFILVCVILFFWVMTCIGKKFQDSQWVATAKLIDAEDALPLPEVTICPVKPYKDKAHHLSHQVHNSCQDRSLFLQEF